MDFLASTAAGEASTFSLSALPSGSEGVKAVAVAARASRDLSVPQSLELALRTGGADHFSSPVALETAYAPARAVWESNPGTASQWSRADVDALEAGVRSAA
jgi:hypothetical protein